MGRFLKLRDHLRTGEAGKQPVVSAFRDLPGRVPLVEFALGLLVVSKGIDDNGSLLQKSGRTCISQQKGTRLHLTFHQIIMGGTVGPDCAKECRAQIQVSQKELVDGIVILLAIETAFTPQEGFTQVTHILL